ncbi:MAG: FCD domain-containing protein [Proteobacteria bacterium]|nr:FCD domain-containing protein [Pseudomonadota bacterium]
MFELDEIRVEKRYEALAEKLREKILTGAIAIGEFLPNERELVEHSGLSRGSVREALRVLETQGLVSTTIGRNNGRRARQPDAHMVRDSLSLFIRGCRVRFPVVLETVETLEPSLAGLAAQHHDDTDIPILSSALETLRATRSAKRFLSANTAWHRAIAQASHNPILIAIYEAVSPGLLEPHVKGFASESVRAAVIHAASRIEEAILARDVETARPRMYRHVKAYRELVEPLAPDYVKF